MSSLDNDINQHFQDAIDVIQWHSDNPYCDPEYKYFEPPMRPSIMCSYPITHPSDVPGPYDWNEQTSWPHVVPADSLGPSGTVEYPEFYSIAPPPRNGKGRKKMRLYEYLHESLGDPNMADSIQWTDRGSSTFHFISKNKEKLAECWGKRKGNRKTMTYQKMARALRNYSRTGEILKVRRKLTYQFNPLIIQRLGGISHVIPPPGTPGLVTLGGRCSSTSSMPQLNRPTMAVLLHLTGTAGMDITPSRETVILPQASLHPQSPRCELR